MAEFLDLGWKMLLGLLTLAGTAYGGWKVRQSREKQATRDAIEKAQGKIELVDRHAREHIARVERELRADLDRAEDRVMRELGALEGELRKKLDDHGVQLAKAATRDDIGDLYEAVGRVAGDVKEQGGLLGAMARQVEMIHRHLLKGNGG